MEDIVTCSYGLLACDVEIKIYILLFPILSKISFL